MFDHFQHFSWKGSTGIQYMINKEAGIKSLLAIPKKFPDNQLCEKKEKLTFP